MEKIIRSIGNILIIASIAALLFIFYPLINIYLYPPAISDNLPSKGLFITIPKIHAQAPIIANVDPWQSSNYLPALQNGVAMAKGFSQPDQPGLTFLFAHSSDAPWRITRYNTIFFRLPELQVGDSIYITQNGQKLNFKVSQKIEVWPNQVEALKQDSSIKQLVLQTCVPIGTSLKRLLIFATPI